MLNNSDSLFYKIGDNEHEIKYYYFSRVNFENERQCYIGNLLRNQHILENQNEISNILAYSIYKFCTLSSSKTVENIVILNVKASGNMVSRMLRNGYNYLDNKIVDLYSADKFFEEKLPSTIENISYSFLCEYADKLSINIKPNNPCNIIYITDLYENSHILVEKVKKIKKELNVNQLTLISLAKPTTRVEYDYVSKDEIDKFLVDYKIYDAEEIGESETPSIFEENSEILDEQKVTETISKKYIKELNSVVKMLNAPKIEYEELSELTIRHNRLHNMISEPYKAVVAGSFRLGKLEIKDKSYPIKSFNSKYGDKLYDLVDGDKFTVVKHSRTTKPLVVDVVTEYIDTSTVNLNHESRRSNRLFDIFLTVTKEQNQIIRDLDLSNTLVTGQAGTGKTQVGLHKLSFNLFNKLIEDPAIILPNYKYKTYIKNSLNLHGIVDIPETNLLTREDFGKYVICRVYQRISAKGVNFSRPLDLNYLIDEDVHSDFFNSEAYSTIENDFIEKYKSNFDNNKLKIAIDHKEFISNRLDFTDMYNGYFINRGRFNDISELIRYNEDIANMARKTIKSKEEFIESSNHQLKEFVDAEKLKIQKCIASIEDKDKHIEQQRELLLNLDSEREEVAIIIKKMEDGRISKIVEQLKQLKNMNGSTYIDLQDFPDIIHPSSSEFVKIDADLKVLNNERKVLQEDVDEKENRINQLEQENLSSSEIMDTNILHISQINQEIGKSLERHDANKLAIANSKTLVEEQESKIITAKRTIERVEQEIESLGSKIIRINTRKSISLLEEQCDSARERISECARKRDEHKRNVENLEGEFKVINEHILELNKQIDNLKNNNTELTHFIDENEITIKKLKADLKNISPRLYELIGILSTQNSKRKMLIVKVNEKKLDELRVEVNPYYKQRTEFIKKIKDIEFIIEKHKKDRYNIERSIPELEDKIKEKTRFTNFNIKAAEETISDKKIELINVENTIASISLVRDSIISAFDFELYFKETINKVYDLGNKLDYSYYLALTNLLLKFDEKLSSSIKFDYFFFDNAECLTRSEVQLIRLIEDNNLLIIGDLNQSLKQSYFGDNWNALTNELYFKEYTLDKQLRASDDFNNYARYYINNKVSLSENIVEYKAAKEDIDKQLIDVINEITASSKSHETYAIICNHQNEYDTLKQLIEKSKYKEYVSFFDNTNNAHIPTGIVLTKIDIAKGLEFHGVITFIQDVRYEELSEIQRHKIYAALSRATNKLFVVKYE